MSELNRTLLREVADLIEREDRFDLYCYAGRIGADSAHGGTRVSYGDEVPSYELLAGRTSNTWGFVPETCRTIGCVAGWVNAFIGHDNASDQAEAALALGLDPLWAEAQLFHADGGSVWARVADQFGWDVREGSDEEFPGLYDWSQITATEAAKVLRMVADGEIDLEGVA